LRDRPSFDVHDERIAPGRRPAGQIGDDRPDPRLGVRLVVPRVADLPPDRVLIVHVRRLLAPKPGTRSRLVTRFKDGTFVWPGALFRLTVDEQAADTGQRDARSGAGWVSPVPGEECERGDATAPEAGDEDAAGFDDEMPVREAA
jgi:hypothetical protein